MRKIICLAFLLLGLGGCVVGPKYKRPVIQAPDKYYTEANPQSSSLADAPWWELFKDPVLQDLIREALKNNYDYQLAVARVEEQQVLLGVTRSQYYPQVAYDASISGRQSNVFPNHTYYSYSFSTFWEIDLFGRIRKMNEAQHA